MSPPDLLRQPSLANALAFVLTLGLELAPEVREEGRVDLTFEPVEP